MLANLRTEAYPAYRQPVYPHGSADAAPPTAEAKHGSAADAAGLRRDWAAESVDLTEVQFSEISEARLFGKAGLRIVRDQSKSFSFAGSGRPRRGGKSGTSRAARRAGRY